MDINQMLFVGTIIVLLAVVVLLAVTNWKQGNRHASQIDRLLAAMSATAQQLAASPVYIETARGVANSIPQEAFNAVLDKFDAFEGLVGQRSQIGQLAQQIEDLVKRLDHDPGNDPKPGASQAGTSPNELPPGEQPPTPPPFTLPDGTPVG